ncbi:hypothetical protein [Pelagibacterium halotolerans]|uniref:hypothetical protein n=1 Tax=Pelagibacterium halotolerans TaxID=531813 RepID=UPI00384C2A91
MITDSLGLTATHMKSGDGVWLHIPYRIPVHGLTLIAADRSVAALVLPVCAIEDPRFGSWLGQRGIYRVENETGSVARIGEGCVIDRVRKHRSAPIIIPARVVAGFGATVQWALPERRYLEGRFASAWVSEGNALAATTFEQRSVGQSHVRARLDADLRTLLHLIRTAERVLDNDADHFSVCSSAEGWPMAPIAIKGPAEEVIGTEVPLPSAGTALTTRTFAAGTRLRYEDGRISALATVRPDRIVLHPGSSIYMQTSKSVGARFVAMHSEFLVSSKAIGNGSVGFTRLAVSAWSAASLLKFVTGGRAHAAFRWRLA